MVVLFYSSAHHSQLCLAKMQPTFVKPLLLKHQCCLIKLPTNRCLFVTFALKKIWCLFTQQTRVFPHSNIFHCIPQTLTFRGNIWSPRSGTNLQSKVRAIKWPQTICHLKKYIYIYISIYLKPSPCVLKLFLVLPYLNLKPDAKSRVLAFGSLRWPETN